MQTHPKRNAFWNNNSNTTSAGVNHVSVPIILNSEDHFLEPLSAIDMGVSIDNVKLVLDSKAPTPTQ